MLLEFNADEMLLALVSMIQVTRPALLCPAGDSFDVDVSPLLAQKDLNEDELLVLRLYGIFSAASEDTSFPIDLSAIEWRSDRKESEFCLSDRRCQVGSGSEPIPGMFSKQFVQARFDEGAFAALDALDLLRVYVNADSLMALLCQANSGNQTNVTGAYDGNAHQASSASWLS